MHNPDIKSAMDTAEHVKATCWLMRNLIKKLNGESQRGAALDGVELHGISCVFEDLIANMESIEADLEPA